MNEFDLWPDEYASAASFTFDVDGETAVLGTAPHLRDDMVTMSQQSYGPKVGVPRLLTMLAEKDIHSTFFVPGYTAERYPDTVERILEDGHEIAHHGYLHEPLVGKSLVEEGDILDRGLRVLQSRFGVRPTGYRAPFWQMNWHTPRLLAERGFVYDSTLMDSDRPYLIATEAGQLVELPITWELDDWGHYCFIPQVSGNAQFTPPLMLAEAWCHDADAVLDENGLWILTNHPFLSGRPARARALAHVIDHVRARNDTWLAPLGDIAAYVTKTRQEQNLPDRPELDIDDKEHHDD